MGNQPLEWWWQIESRPDFEDSFQALLGALAIRSACQRVTLVWWRTAAMEVDAVLFVKHVFSARGTCQNQINVETVFARKWVGASLLCACRKDWLVEFDGDISMDMSAIRTLVDKYRDKPLLLLKWRSGCNGYEG